MGGHPDNHRDIGKKSEIEQLKKQNAELAEKVRQLESKLDAYKHFSGHSPNVNDIQHDLFYLIERLPVMAFVLGDDDRIQYWNRKCQIITGYARDKIVNNSDFLKVLMTDHDEQERTRILKSASEIENFETVIIAEDRSKKVISWSAVDFATVSGWKKIVLGFDVSEHREVEEKLRESEEQYRGIVERIQETIYRISVHSGRFEYVSPSCYRVFGYTEEELKNPELTLFDLIHPDFRKFINEKWQLIRDGRIDPLMEYKILDKEGKTHWIAQSLKGLFDNDNRLIALEGICRNITAQKRFQEELTKAYSAIENTQAAITVSDLNGNLIYCNSAAIRLWGFSSHLEMLSLPVNRMWSDQSETSIADIRKQVIEKGHYSGYDELIARRHDGSTFPVDFRASLMKDAQGKITGMTASWQDITERKRAEEELIRAKEKAEESDRLKSSFLANMSHEIRTPMNGIIGFASLLKRNNLTAETRNKYVDIINKNGETLMNLIEDIIDLAKIEAGQLTVHKSECDLRSLMQEVDTLFRETILSSANVQLRLCLPEDTSADNVQTDSSRLKQIITNLLSNALKFTDEGEIKFGYILREDNFIEFFVKDSGIGMNAEELDLIFERFRQVDDSSTRKYGGAGLGLTITKNLVNLLGGEIKVESEPNKGSVFSFTLPYVEAGHGSLSETKKYEEDPERERFWHGKTILIAEDEDANYLFLEEVLLPTGLTIVRANDGMHAIEHVHIHKPDLILMDVKMPRLNGLDATRQIKNKLPDIPIIAQTAYAMQEEKDLILDAGCDGYVIKPIDRKKLMWTIAEFLEKS
ncbi:MAG TPA: PAS domain S-box protein [Bacteroidales bacterium]|nr:PAS domain S-box protein [Bacteroidales bacterium]